MTEKAQLEQAVAGVARSLEILAAKPQDQLAYLKSIGDQCMLMDELALEFDDRLSSLRAFIAEGKVGEDAAHAIAALDRLLIGMSGEKNAHLWTREALTSSSEWAQVRRLAERALAALAPRQR